MPVIDIEVSADAARIFKSCCLKTQKEITMIVEEIILTMPVEAGNGAEPECHYNAPNIKSCSPAGSMKSSTEQRSKLRVMPVLALLTIFLASSLKTQAQSLVGEKLLAAVLQVESSGRHTAVGDLNKATGNYRAKGGYQFWRPTWNHVSQIRQKSGLQTISYEQGATHPAWSREYARSYLTWIERYLRDRGVNTPTRSQIYAGYNWGVGSFRKVAFDVSKAPATTQRACRKIEALCR
jgi:hypothetical protein